MQSQYSSSSPTALDNESVIVKQEPASDRPILKKRNIDRACDACRRKKARCDGPEMPGHICSSCLHTRKLCTYVEPSKPRGPSKAYVSGLEDRLEALETILAQVHPDVDFTDVLGPPIIRDSWKTDLSSGSVTTRHTPKAGESSSSNSPSTSAPPAPLEQSTHLIFPTNHNTANIPQKSAILQTALDAGSPASNSSAQKTSDDEESDYDSEDSNYQDRTETSRVRFYGLSNPLRLAGMTRKLRHRQMREKSDAGSTPESHSSSPSTSLQRPKFWAIPSWEMSWNTVKSDPYFLQRAIACLPPDDLADSLWHLYFLHVNAQFPLLHRPSLEKLWKERVQCRDLWFACLCLASFAVASRWSDDPRVLAKSTINRSNWHSAGADFFSMAMNIYSSQTLASLLYPPRLFEIQSHSLLAMFLRGTASHTLGWLVVSAGIRKCQDLGVHRKIAYSRQPTVDEELWKRAFWLLAAFDRISSASLGRSCVLGEEDHDLDLPTEVDDEYWEVEDQEQCFRQPSDVPARAAAFNLWVKLTQVVAFTLRALYAVDNSKLVIGKFSLGSPEELVAQLDAALQEWYYSVPSHLQWSGEIENKLFSDQSMTLYTTYYMCQMLIYRPFIPRPGASKAISEHASPLALSAMRICTDAATACVRIIEVQLQRGISNIANLVSVANHSAALLLINIWDLKAQEALRKPDDGCEDIKPPIAHSIDLLMKDVTILIRALEWAEPRYAAATHMLHSLRDSLPSEDEVIDRQHAANFQQTQHLTTKRRMTGYSREPSPIIPSQQWAPPPNRAMYPTTERHHQHSGWVPEDVNRPNVGYHTSSERLVPFTNHESYGHHHHYSSTDGPKPPLQH